MLTLILKLGNEQEIIELTDQDILGLLEALRKSTILDVDGDTWTIDPNENLYFEAYPPHFEITCKKRD